MLKSICGSEPRTLRCNNGSRSPNRKGVRPHGRQKTPRKAQADAPGEDVVEKIDKKHSDADFLSDLEKATTDKARKLLDLPSGRGRA
jgi:hypothetical protein